MALKINQQVIWLGHNNNTLDVELKSGTVTKVAKDTVWINGQHKPEDCLYAAFCYPDNAECRELLEDTIAMKARHKAEDKAMMARQFQMINKCVQEGTK